MAHRHPGLKLQNERYVIKQNIRRWRMASFYTVFLGNTLQRCLLATSMQGKSKCSAVALPLIKVKLLKNGHSNQISIKIAVSEHD